MREGTVRIDSERFAIFRHRFSDLVRTGVDIAEIVMRRCIATVKPSGLLVLLNSFAPLASCVRDVAEAIVCGALALVGCKHGLEVRLGIGVVSLVAKQAAS